MKFITRNGKYIYPLGENTTPELFLNNGRLGLFSVRPQDGEEIGIADVIGKINGLENEINDQLIQMSNPTHLCMNGLVSGNNVFLVSKPGAAKTTLARKIGEAIGKFDKINFTPETTKNDLFGPVSIDGIKKGLWTREWSRITKAHVFLADEFYKGSSAIRNSLLDVAEEHVVSDGQGSQSIPLLLLIGASNELVSPDENNAMWDRFSLRCEVYYPNEEKDMLELYSSDSGKRPIKTKIDPDQVQLLQGYCETEAMNLPKEIRVQLVKVLQALLKSNINISPRRRLAWAKSVVATSLLSGDKLSPEHLIIGQDMLWIDPKQKNLVDEKVIGACDPKRMIILHGWQDIETIRDGINNATVGHEVSNLVGRLKTTIVRVQEEYLKEPDQEKKDLLGACEKLRISGLEKMQELIASK